LPGRVVSFFQVTGSDTLRSRIALIAFLLLCSLGTMNTAWQTLDTGDTLSRVDPYSEANAIREARNFLERGLFADAGLGNVVRPGLYPDEGFVSDPKDMARSVTPSGVYTHYPPGPEYLLYLAMTILGPSPVAHLRLLPLTICWGATLFFGLSIRQRFGPAVGWFVMLACTALPLFSDANAFLQYDGYAFALLLVEIGVCLRTGTGVLPFAILGFLQGWLSFDYVFLVTLVPAAIALALPRLPAGSAPPWRSVAVRCAAAGMGFAGAHLLHFAQVWIYFGSLHAALEDLGGAAAYRSGVESGSLLSHLLKMDGVIFSYFVSAFPVSTFFWQPDALLQDNWRMCRFLGLTLGPWWLVLTLGFMLRSLRTRTRAALNDTVLLGDWLFVSLCGFVPSALWMELMVNHAILHRQFLYRHLFFGFFLWLLFLAIVCCDHRARVVENASPQQRMQARIAAVTASAGD